MRPLARRTTGGARGAAACLLVLGAVAGCGGGDEPGDSPAPAGPGDELDGDQLRAAVEEDRGSVDRLTQEVAPVLAEAVGGQVLGAYGNVEGCNGGSFEGSTAYGYQVQGRLVGFRATDQADVAASVESALKDAGWTGTEVIETTPGRTGVEGSSNGAQVNLTLSDELPGALFTVRGRCLPVTDDGREAVTDLTGSREVIAKQ